MGFIAKLKQMFSSNIVYSSDGETRLGVLYKNKATKLKINSYIVIEDRSTCIVVYKSNIMDFLYGKGKFRITKDDLPHLFDRAITEKNKDCKYIKADLYFVNATELKKFVFSSSKPFILKTRDYGKIVGWVEGYCTLSVVSVKDLFDWLFLIRRHFKSGKIDSIIEEQIGNAVCRAIEKSKLDIKDIVLKNLNINEYLSIELANAFEDLGFAIKDVELKGIQFNAKAQEKINAILHREYEKINKTKTKYITISTDGEAEVANGDDELILANDNVGCVCSHCGKSLDKSYEFCPYCGERNIRN